MDGYGYNPEKKGNAIYAADGDNIKRLQKEYPSTLIGASGMDVGLPDGQMGNSEVGHLNIGAGRVVYQDLTKITKAINDGDFFTNSALLKAVDNAVENGKNLHLFGLLSTGGVHSHITHLFALLKLAKESGVKNSSTAGYYVSQELIELIKSFEKEDWEQKLDTFKKSIVSIIGKKKYCFF